MVHATETIKLGAQKADDLNRLIADNEDSASVVASGLAESVAHISLYPKFEVQRTSDRSLNTMSQEKTQQMREEEATAQCVRGSTASINDTATGSERAPTSVGADPSTANNSKLDSAQENAGRCSQQAANSISWEDDNLNQRAEAVQRIVEISSVQQTERVDLATVSSDAEVYGLRTHSPHQRTSQDVVSCESSSSASAVMKGHTGEMVSISSDANIIGNQHLRHANSDNNAYASVHTPSQSNTSALKVAAEQYFNCVRKNEMAQVKDWLRQETPEARMQLGKVFILLFSFFLSSHTSLQVP